MKYEQKDEIEFVRCDNIEPKNIHESKMTDDGLVCAECQEHYEMLTDDLINEYVDDNPKRSLVDFHEVEHDHGTNRLSFGFWSEPQ